MSESIVLAALRREDMVVLTFELFNLEPTDDGKLVRVNGANPATVVVHFPPQSLVEQVFPQQTVGNPPAPPIRTALAGASRLAFRLPAEVDELPSTLHALLQWDSWEPLVAAGALPADAVIPDDQPPPAAPGPSETAVEFPWRLVLSPDHGNEKRWYPVTSDDHG